MSRAPAPQDPATPIGGAAPGDGEPEQTLHASCVVLERRGLLILGAAGTGKSALALGLMALGAALVSDDRTHVRRRGDRVYARAPEAIAGLIEARGLGILRAEAVAEVRVSAVMELDRRDLERLPPPRTIALLGCEVPLLHGQLSPYLPAALLQYFKGGRQA